jgi:hypothetical protein
MEVTLQPALSNWVAPARRGSPAPFLSSPSLIKRLFVSISAREDLSEEELDKAMRTIITAGSVIQRLQVLMNHFDEPRSVMKVFLGEALENFRAEHPDNYFVKQRREEDRLANQPNRPINPWA